MKHFIRYLYAYQQGQRVANVGFAKIKKEEKFCKVQVQGKHLNPLSDGILKLYLFTREKEGILCTYQGSVKCKNEVVGFELEYTNQDLGDIPSFEAVDGLILVDLLDMKYGVAWDDMPIDTTHIYEKKYEDAQREPESASQTESEPQPEPEPQLEPEPATAPDAVPEPLTEQDKKMIQELDATAQEIPRQTFRKITRRDIGRLPRNDWKLANNSFLLHGYYNYHHLLLSEVDGKRMIGVPGIFHEREEAAAKAFGFPIFVRLPQGEINLNDEETNAKEDFGYWCRQIDSDKL